MSGPSIPELAAKIWLDAGGDEDHLSRLSFGSEEPVLPSPFRVDAAAGTSIGVAGLAAAALHKTRTGEDQQVSVDLRHAAAAFRGEYHVHVDDGPAPEKWNQVSGYYQARDGRWMQLHCNFPHFREGILKILGAREEPEDVARQVAKWDGPELEQTLIDAGMAAAMMRSPEEWDRHPQADAMRHRKRRSKPVDHLRVSGCWICPGLLPGRSVAVHWPGSVPTCSVSQAPICLLLKIALLQPASANMLRISTCGQMRVRWRWPI